MMQVNYSAKLEIAIEEFLTGDYILNIRKNVGPPYVASQTFSKLVLFKSVLFIFIGLEKWGVGIIEQVDLFVI